MNPLDDLQDPMPDPRPSTFLLDLLTAIAVGMVVTIPTAVLLVAVYRP